MLARFTAWTLLAAAGFALFAAGAQAQDPPKPTKDAAYNSAVSKMGDYRDIPRGGIPKEDLEQARKHFARYAQYYAEIVAYTPIYKAPQDFKTDPPFAIDGPNGIMQEINRFLLDPTPNGKKYGADQFVYIREFGAAFDAPLKKLIETHADPIVRINAARVLAYICRAGSPAHYPTLTELIASPTTRTEIKYHLFHAAENLLAVYDLNWPKTRNHVVQTDEPKQLGALVKAIDDCINTPSLLVLDLPDGKTDKATSDQLAVLGLVRRQAIKALAQVRYVTVAGPDGVTPLYPAYTLARVALSDPAFVPAPGPADTADAVLGIFNMAPVEVKGDRVKPARYNADAAVEAVTAGLITFAKPRAANAFDRSLPWRSYALRLAEGMRTWRMLFDPDYERATPNKFDATRVPAVVEEFYKEVVPNVLAPMDKVDFNGKPDIGATVAIEALQNRLATIRANPKRGTLLFPNVPRTTIDFARAKK